MIYFNISIPLHRPSENVIVTIYKITGKLVYHKMQLEESRIEVDLSDNPKGIYFVKVVIENSVFKSKLIYE